MVSRSHNSDGAEGEGPGAGRLDVLRVLASRARRGELPPTAREVARVSGYKSSRTGQRILGDLEDAGLIERPATPTNHRRPVRVTELGWRAVGESTVMGRIGAGRGLEAIAAEEAYSVAGELLLSGSGRQRYLLRVVGDSMVDAKISDGDLVVVEADEDPPDGSVVVALLEGDEVTVKRLYRHDRHVNHDQKNHHDQKNQENGSVRLKAESAGHEDIVVPLGEVEIQGRVVASIHSF